ncbi:MAG: serine--tRNA ligase [Candidatus Taylorbacteria bacterium]|nr:serine--tRNA ligase [Candidatus Taylorbacteria bacterium]
MLDIKFIRENKDIVKDGARKKHIDFDVERLVAVDTERRELITSLESKKAEQNKVSQEITSTSDQAHRASLIENMRVLKESMKSIEEKLQEVMQEWQKLMVAVPNIPDMSVPEGATDAENVEIKTWGEIPKFDFTPKSHIDLMLQHDMLDLERGTKVAGFRGYFLKNAAVQLHFALWQYIVETFTKQGYELMMVPSLVKRETLMGTGYIPQGEDDLYKTQDNDYLAGTGEVATMSYYSDEIIDAKDLPKKILAFSPCFRREAGSHGKDTRGLIRVHEFYKWEQVILCEANHEQSVQFHEEVTANSEKLVQALGIPYHLVLICGGDLGLGQVKKYDIECWVPAENTYRETHSASYFHDFQTRRLNIRYRDADGTLRFVHSLNNTAAATPRLLVSIIENYQQADGSIKIPEVLRPYMGGREYIGK